MNNNDSSGRHQITTLAAPSIRPSSATDFGWSLVALGLSLSLVWTMAPWHSHGSVLARVPYAPLIPCLGIATVFLVVHFSVSGAGHLPRSADRAVTGSWQRLTLRCLGVSATFALIAFAYWLLPEYRSTFYEPFWRYLRTLAPLAVFVPIYLWWADRYIPAEEDEYLHFGSLFVRSWTAVDLGLVRRHLLSWLVKAFFLPLMTVYLSRELSAFYDALQDAHRGTLHGYQIFFHLSYLTDLLFAVVGYTLTMRLLGTHMRSVEPTLLGWAVALSCYQPFMAVIGHSYTGYDDRAYWDGLLEPWPAVQLGFGITIVTLTLIYGLATAAFGIRFSNLTHRGIITAGPYRFSKHPAYLSKNLSWWLISMPMFSHMGLAAALRNCGMLALVNALYYARARTEERHLSRDPVYVAYALWIDQHGLLAPVARWLPFLRYRPASGDQPTAVPSRSGPTG